MGFERIIIQMCRASDDVLHAPFKELKPNIREYIEDIGGLPCEGGGVPGNWCKRAKRGWETCDWYFETDDVVEQGTIYRDDDHEKLE